MTTERITPTELDAVRDRHRDIEQDTLLEAERITCRFILDDGETCRHGLYIEDHDLVDGKWVHPDYLDENGRWRFNR